MTTPSDNSTPIIFTINEQLVPASEFAEKPRADKDGYVVMRMKYEMYVKLHEFLSLERIKSIETEKRERKRVYQNDVTDLDNKISGEHAYISKIRKLSEEYKINSARKEASKKTKTVSSSEEVELINDKSPK